MLQVYVPPAVVRASVVGCVCVYVSVECPRAILYLTIDRKVETSETTSAPHHHARPVRRCSPRAARGDFAAPAGATVLRRMT